MDQSRYIFAVEAMFNDAMDEIEGIVLRWKFGVVDELVIDTPGPGNQYDATEYIATGRLRAGYQWSTGSPPATVPALGRTGAEDGDQYAAATRLRLKAAMKASGAFSSGALYNEVGYGLYVHEGLENHAHIGARPFAQKTAARAGRIFERMRISVMGDSLA
jgi:hypothetical protein